MEWMGLCCANSLTDAVMRSSKASSPMLMACFNRPQRRNGTAQEHDPRRPHRHRDPRCLAAASRDAPRSGSMTGSGKPPSMAGSHRLAARPRFRHPAVTPTMDVDADMLLKKAIADPNPCATALASGAIPWARVHITPADLTCGEWKSALRQVWMSATGRGCVKTQCNINHSRSLHRMDGVIHEAIHTRARIDRRSILSS